MVESKAFRVWGEEEQDEDGATGRQDLVSLVLPVREEASSIGKTLTRVERFLRSVKWSAEVVVVDDSSSDGTAEAAVRWKNYLENLSVLRHSRRQGRGMAARTGALMAHGGFFVVVDSRGETPLEESVPLLDLVQDGADVAIASRRMPGCEVSPSTSFLDRASETTFAALSKLLLPLRVRDTGAQVMAFRRPAGRCIAKRARVAGDAFGIEWLALASRLGLQLVEVPVSWLDRNDEMPRRRPNEVLMLRDVWKLRRRLGRPGTPKAKAAHVLLHETSFTRVDRIALGSRRR